MLRAKARDPKCGAAWETRSGTFNCRQRASRFWIRDPDSPFPMAVAFCGIHVPLLVQLQTWIRITEQEFRDLYCKGPGLVRAFLVMRS